MQRALSTNRDDSQKIYICFIYLSLNQLFDIFYGADFDFPCLLIYVLLCTTCHRFPDNSLRLAHLSCALFGTEREPGKVITRGPQSSAQLPGRHGYGKVSFKGSKGSCNYVNKTCLNHSSNMQQYIFI